MEEAINKFMSHVENLYDFNSDGVDGFSIEFQKIKTFSSSLKKQPNYLCSSGEQEDNKKKNRYKDILPFDRTRVKLPKTDSSLSDYINASFIKGAGTNGPYIASQGPLPHTVNDFWHMLWHCNVKVVIMVCREVELGKRKCERYWAEENEKKQFEDIIVTLESQQNTNSGFCQRNIVAQKGQEVRKLVQLHYTTWPDHGVPRTREEILTMISKARKLQDYQLDSINPLCVHCSAGCGRTGAVLVIDYFRNLLTHKNLPNDITAFEVIKEMRKQRPAIVQTKDQYEFVHLAVSEMFTKHLTRSGKEPVTNFSKSLLSTNYENVVLPRANTPPLKHSNSNEMSRQSYENVSLLEPGERRRPGSSVVQTIEGSPPPKPGRRVVDRNPGATGQSRPVSSIEPMDHRHLATPVASARKASLPAKPERPDAKVAPPKPKPVLQKKPSDPKPRLNLTNSPQNKFNTDKQSAEAVNAQATPRFGKQSEFHGLQGKTDKQTIPSQVNSSDLASNVSVQQCIEKMHEKSNFARSPPVMPKPRSNPDKQIVIAESLQKRKERLWSNVTGSEQSNLKKTNQKVTASAIDLRMIDEPTFRNPRKSFTRTVSVDKGNLDKPGAPSSVLYSDNCTRQASNKNNNSSCSAESDSTSRVRDSLNHPASSHIAGKPKPPVLPKKSFKRKPIQQCEPSKTDDKQITSHPSAEELNIINNGDKVGYVNVKETTSNSNGYEVVDLHTKKLPEASIYTPLNVPKVKSPSDNAYDLLKRSFKVMPKGEDSQHAVVKVGSSDKKELRSYSESAVTDEVKSLPKTILFDSPQPFSRSSLSSSTSSVFDASPISNDTTTQVLNLDLHNPCFGIDVKTKPSPPIKPQRTSKRPKNPVVQAPNKSESPYCNQDMISDSPSKQNNLTFPSTNNATSHYYSEPPKGNQDSQLSVNNQENAYASVDDTVVSAKKGPPNLPARPQQSEAPELPTRTAESYIFNEGNLYEDDPTPFEKASGNKPSHQETGRRTSGASSHSGFKARTKDLFGKTTNVLKVTAQNITGARANEDHNYDPSARTPTFQQTPVIYGNQDISYGQRYPRKPRGGRPAPSKWTSNI